RDLLEELSDQRRLAGPRVTHQEEMAALLLAGNPEDLASGPSQQQRRNRHGVVCREADSVTALQPVELRGAAQFMSSERLAQSHALCGAAISRVAEDDRNRDGGQWCEHPPWQGAFVRERIRLNLRRQLRASRIRSPRRHARELEAFGAAVDR